MMVMKLKLDVLDSMQRDIHARWIAELALRQYNNGRGFLIVREDEGPGKNKLKNFGLNTDHAVVIIGWGKEEST